MLTMLSTLYYCVLQFMWFPQCYKDNVSAFNLPPYAFRCSALCKDYQFWGVPYIYIYIYIYIYHYTWGLICNISKCPSSVGVCRMSSLLSQNLIVHATSKQI